MTPIIFIIATHLKAYSSFCNFLQIQTRENRKPLKPPLGGRASTGFYEYHKPETEATPKCEDASENEK
jgi:hypothetical protein